MTHFKSKIIFVLIGIVTFSFLYSQKVISSPSPKADIQFLSLLFKPTDNNFEFSSFSNDTDLKNLLDTFSPKSITQKLDDLKQKGKVEIIGTFNLLTSNNEEIAKEIKIKNLSSPESADILFNDILISTHLTTKIESKESMILTISQLSTLNLKNTPLKTRLDARFPFKDNQTLMFYSPVYHSDKKDEKGEAIKVYLITLINPHVIY